MRGDLAGSLPEETLPLWPQQQKCLQRWKCRQEGAATASLWPGGNVGKHQTNASFGQKMKADPGSSDSASCVHGLSHHIDRDAVETLDGF